MVLQTPVDLCVLIPMHLITFATAAFLCHSALANDRPAPSSLTEFYFWIALGGMLGGLFNTLAAPLLFSGVVEYPVVLTMYLSRLAPGGVLAFHISNRHLSLGPVVARLARSHGWTALEQAERVAAEDVSLGKIS